MKRTLKLTITKIRRQTIIREIAINKVIYPVRKENAADQKQSIKKAVSEKPPHQEADD